MESHHEAFPRKRNNKVQGERTALVPNLPIGNAIAGETPFRDSVPRPHETEFLEQVRSQSGDWEREPPSYAHYPILRWNRRAQSEKSTTDMPKSTAMADENSERLAPLRIMARINAIK